MPSDLQRAAQGLVECLDQVPEIVAYLQRLAARCREQASFVADISGHNPAGRAAAVELDTAARCCDEAAYLAGMTPIRAKEWAVALVGGNRLAPSTTSMPTPTDASNRKGQGLSREGDGAEVGKDIARGVGAALGLTNAVPLRTLQDAFRFAYDSPAPFIVKLADDMLIDLRDSVARSPGQRIAFVGRDGRSLAIAIAELDPDFFRSHCSEVVLSRALVEAAVQDLEQNQGKSFPQLHGFRGASKKVDPADRVGAVDALTDYLHDHHIPVGMPSSRVTLVDTSYKGTVQELLAAVYPATTFDGRYAFFAESPHDPHRGSKRGYALHLDAADSNSGIPIDVLPADISRTFAHQDALGSIEETLHGPLSSPKRIAGGRPAQHDLRTQTDTLDGLNHVLVSPRLTDATVREGVMRINLLAVQRYAGDVAAVRDRGGDYRAILDEGSRRYRMDIRAWISKEGADPKFCEFMDSFVRRTDKRHASVLAAALRQASIPTADAAGIWDQYSRCSTDEDKNAFVKKYLETREATGA